MKVAILGYGLEGQAAYEYWREGNEITVCDRNEAVALPAGVASQLGADYLKGLDRFELIVRSPNIHPRDIVTANDPAILEKVTSNLNEFLSVCPTKNIVGVTGTKGKGTTSTLIAKLLGANDKRVHLGGNIGIAPLAMLKNPIEPDDWVVLELSSFQLIDLRTSPHIAVCLMVIPEHQNWHDSIDEYYEVKSQLFAHQTQEDFAVYFAENETSKQIAHAGAGQKIPYFAPPGAVVKDEAIVVGGQTICRTSELKLLGKHNWQNVCAAVTAVWQAGGHNVSSMQAVLTSFTGLEHRLQFIRELNGVQYYDDSFGTTPETAIVAIEAFSKPKVIILGGSTKGADFDTLAEILKASDIRQIILMGNPTNTEHPSDSPKIEATLGKHGIRNVTSLIRPGGPSIAEVVQAARATAKDGDVVLLSAACASFDMFNNYKERGEQFSQAVRALA